MSAGDFIADGDSIIPISQSGQAGSQLMTDANGNLLLALGNVTLTLGNLVLTAGQVVQTGAGPGSGGTAVPLKITDFLLPTGLPLAVSAGSGTFGLSNTNGTSLFLISEAANNNTKTDITIFEYVVPSNYVAGNNITVTVNSNYVIGGGTLSTKTLAAAAYLIANADTEGSSLIATAAATITGAAADYAFVITGTTLTPGARLLLLFTMVLTETASSNVTGRINSVRIN